ncbi:MAG: hypothetical protein ACI4NJ_12035 [Cellvibrio sp.]
MNIEKIISKIIGVILIIILVKIAFGTLLASKEHFQSRLKERASIGKIEALRKDCERAIQKLQSKQDDITKNSANDLCQKYQDAKNQE